MVQINLEHSTITDIFNSFIKEQFNYRPLFNTRAVNHKMKLCEWGLRVWLNDVTSTFNETLSKSNDTAIQVENIQKRRLNSSKNIYGFSSPIMTEVVIKSVLKYNVWSCRVTFLQNSRNNKYASDTVVYKAAQISSMLPASYKNLSSTDLLKCKIKNGRGSDCLRHICRIFADGVCFINWK